MNVDFDKCSHETSNEPLDVDTLHVSEKVEKESQIPFTLNVSNKR